MGEHMTGCFSGFASKIVILAKNIDKIAKFSKIFSQNYF